jgi:hypothetical protein
LDTKGTKATKALMGKPFQSLKTDAGIKKILEIELVFDNTNAL